jgi:protein required for attachment to host cells
MLLHLPGNQPSRPRDRHCRHGKETARLPVEGRFPVALRQGPREKGLMRHTKENTMSEFWIVVAESSRARIFTADQPTGPLAEIETLANPEARLPERELSSDLPGVTFDSGGRGRHVKEQQVGPKAQAVVRFAELVAARIERGRTGGEFKRAMLVAAPEFLGLLRDKLPAPARGVIEAEIAKNLAQLPAAEIRGHLPERLYSTVAASG